MKNYTIYEHIEGLPNYLDTEAEEVAEYIAENCRTEKEIEKEIENINKITPFDRYGRKRNLYIYRY